MLCACLPWPSRNPGELGYLPLHQEAIYFQEPITIQFQELLTILLTTSKISLSAEGRFSAQCSFLIFSVIAFRCGKRTYDQTDDASTSAFLQLYVYVKTPEGKTSLKRIVTEAKILCLSALYNSFQCRTCLTLPHEVSLIDQLFVVAFVKRTVPFIRDYCKSKRFDFQTHHYSHQRTSTVCK